MEMTAVVGENHHKDMMKKKEKGVVIQPFNTLGPLFLEMLVGEFKLENFPSTSLVLEKVLRYYVAFILAEEIPVIGH